MKYYAHYNEHGLVLVGAQETVPDAERVELSAEQAGSLLTGKTSWRDWEISAVDGQPLLRRRARELKFLEAARRLEPVLDAVEVHNNAYVYLTLSRQPFALVGSCELNAKQAKKLLKRGEVDLWKVKH